VSLIRVGVVCDVGCALVLAMVGHGPCLDGGWVCGGIGCGFGFVISVVFGVCVRFRWGVVGGFWSVAVRGLALARGAFWVGGWGCCVSEVGLFCGCVGVWGLVGG